MSYGKVNCLVGITGSGKTTLIKQYAKKAIGKEIICYARIESDIDIKGAKVYTDFLQFLDAVVRAKDCIIIIDEAFTCLPKKLNIKIGKPNDPHNKIADLLVNARKMNNFVFILFHAFSQVPTEWLIPYLDYFIAFLTNDLMQYQIQRFRSFPLIVEYLSGKLISKKFAKRTIKLR